MLRVCAASLLFASESRGIGLFQGVEKRAQLALGPVRRLQQWDNDQAPSFMHSELSKTARFSCCSKLSTYSEALRA